MLDRSAIRSGTRSYLPPLALIGVILGLVLSGCTSHTPGSVTLMVRSGSVTITHSADGKSEAVHDGQQAILAAQDSLTAAGRGILYFPQVALAFESGTQLTLSNYAFNNDQLRVTLDIKAGQMHTTYDASTTTAQYTFTTRQATIGSAANSTELIAWVTDSETRVGVISGSATVTGHAQAVTLQDGQGTRIASGAAPDQPSHWSLVRVPVYLPSFAPLTLPVILTNLDSGISYAFPSDQSTMVPNGNYSLLIGDERLLLPYKVDKITLPIQDQKAINELPITFGQVVFHAGDAKALLIQSADGKSRMVATGDKVLTAPGSQTLTLARQDRPGSTQSIDLNLLPGQTKMVEVASNLFGAGQIAVKVTGPDDQVMTVQVYIFQINNENGQPLQKFTSDKFSGVLPEDKYAVVIPLQATIPIAVRFEAEISAGKVQVAQTPVAALEVKMGLLALTYPRNGVILLIAQADKMQQAQVPIDLKSILDARSAAATRDYIAALKTNSQGKVQIALPEGQYAIVIDGQKDYKLEGVKVNAGETTSVTLMP